MDFSQIGNALSAAAQLASRSGAVDFPIMPISTANVNTGSFSMASIMQQRIIGSSNEFLWGVNKWDDCKGIVV
jgi:hypothetical protein